jgi:hypothetical protein
MTAILPPPLSRLAQMLVKLTAFSAIAVNEIIDSLDTERFTVLSFEVVRDLLRRPIE